MPSKTREFKKAYYMWKPLSLPSKNSPGGWGLGVAATLLPCGSSPVDRRHQKQTCDSRPAN